jgi:ABC-type multidrug transport system fused ATPase/permease subunit
MIAMTFKEIMIRLYPFLKPYSRWIYYSLGVTVVLACLSQINPIIVKYAVNNIQSLLNQGKSISSGWSLMIMISSILLGKELIMAFFQFWQKFIGEKLKVEVGRDLSNFAISRILGYSLSFHASVGNEPGKLGTRIDRGVDGLTKTIKNIFVDILPLFASALFALIIMFSANVFVGLVASVIVPIYFILSFKQAKVQKGVRKSIQEYKEERNSKIINIFNSILVVKSFVREDFEGDGHKQLNDQLSEVEIAHHRVNFIYDSLKLFSEQIGVVLVIIVTAFLVLDKQMDLGAIMLHILLFNNIAAPIKHLHRIYDEYNEAVSYAEGFFKAIESSESEVKELKGQRRGNLTGNVKFGYDETKPVLHGITFEIPAGKTTALVGLSGAGKTTILNLLAKFYRPDSGSITLDETPLEEWDSIYLREHIGVVLQSNHIFSGTIEENIKYGNLEATFEQIELAAKQAFIHEEIMNMPKNYKTRTQELSGGQKQRLSLARMFLKNPPIVFLDEPTASLDAVATEQIKNSIDAIKVGRTVVIISHNISQFVDADLIYVIDRGRIVEQGNHKSLYQNEGLYKEIIDSNARSLNIEKLSETIGRKI